MINKELQKRIFSSIILIPIAIFFIIKGSFLFNFFIIIIFLISSYEWYMMSKKKNYHYFGYFFLIFSFYAVYQLRNNFGDVLYVENRAPVSRSGDQIEDIKLVVKF